MVSYGYSGHGQLGHSTSISFGGNQNSNIPCKTNIDTSCVYLDCHGPRPVHPTLAHTWGDYFNNPKNLFTGSWKVRSQERGGQTGHGSYNSSQSGQGSRHGYHNQYQLPSIPTIYIQQAPVTNTTTNALPMVTNTDTSSTIPN